MTDDAVIQDLARHAGQQCIDILMRTVELADEDVHFRLAMRVLANIGGAVAAIKGHADGIALDALVAPDAKDVRLKLYREVVAVLAEVVA